MIEVSGPPLTGGPLAARRRELAVRRRELAVRRRETARPVPRGRPYKARAAAGGAKWGRPGLVYRARRDEPDVQAVDRCETVIKVVGAGHCMA